jgi:cytidylate kinase
MSRPSTIAIDGPSAAGKNTVGRRLAEKMGYRFVDTGAMYRALTWLAIKRGVDLDDEEALGELTLEADMDIRCSNSDTHNQVFVNGRDVTAELRRADVDRGVSLVSKVPAVREAMVAKQRQLAHERKVVMVGRDIGTVVLHDADMKFYLSASPEERARRRYLEQMDKGQSTDYGEVLDDLNRRDGIDSRRAHSPLKPAEDAVIVDTDGVDADGVVAEIVRLIEAR